MLNTATLQIIRRKVDKATKRPGNKNGAIPGKTSKEYTNRAERREGRRQKREWVDE